MTCKNCNTQSVEDTTTLPLHKIINIPLKVKSESEHMIKHLNNNCVGSSLTTQVLGIFFGTGYINNKLIWKKFQNTKLLDKDAEDHISSWPKWKSKETRQWNTSSKNNFLSIPRCIQQQPRHRGNSGHLKDDIRKEFFRNTNGIIQNDIKNIFIKYV